MPDDVLRREALAKVEAILGEIMALSRPSVIVRHPDIGYEGDDGVGTTAREVARQVAESLIRGGAAITVPSSRDDSGEQGWGGRWEQPPITRQLQALAYLLGLTDGERRFVQHLAEEPTDKLGLMAFADWLEEQGRAEAARLRELAEKS